MNTKELFDFWEGPARIQPNGFKFKSLSCWSLNISVGCSHACRFCYVPSISTNKLKPHLQQYGVHAPDAQWGDYSLLRRWDEKAFLSSLRKAEKTDPANLNPDGNRAVILCSTTDPYQVFHASSPEKTNLLNSASLELVRRSLELILEHSTLNVRILTRSPQVKKHFDLFKQFGNRLLLGMILPTLDNGLAKIYEPKAPAPSQRLQTLKAAREAGVPLYVAVAPTYPECSADDLRRTLLAVRDLDPATIFYEPINIRAENVQRIVAHAQQMGRTLRTEVFQSKGHWACYALESLQMVERLAHELNLIDRLHLWPDQTLSKEKNFLDAMKIGLRETERPNTPYEKARWKEAQRPAYEKTRRWIERWHSRKSEWPGQSKAQRLVAPSRPQP